MNNSEILEWFYEHDSVWQNDIIIAADAEPGSDDFYSYIRKTYNL